METAVPGTSISVVNAPPPTKVVVIEQGKRRMRGFCYDIAFITLFAALVLSIIAIVKDDLTKVTFHSTDGTYSEYCGWRSLHSYDSASPFLGTPYTFTYSRNCESNDRACELQKVGTAWYALLITGIVFGGLALIAYILDFSVPLTCAMIVIFSSLFFGCMLADVLVWGLFKTCDKLCNTLQFPDIPDDISSCDPSWGISWILVVVAGGLACLSTLFALASKLMTNNNKRY